MDHSAAPIFDALVNYRAHGQYRFAPPDTVRAMRMREPAPPSAVMRSTRASSPRRVGRPPILARVPVPGRGADGRRGRRGTSYGLRGQAWRGLRHRPPL